MKKRILLLILFLITIFLFSDSTGDNVIYKVLNPSILDMYRIYPKLFFSSLYDFDDSYVKEVEKICKIAKEFVREPMIERRSIYIFLDKIKQKFEDKEYGAVIDLCLAYSIVELNLNSFDDFCLGKNISLLVYCYSRIDIFKRYERLSEISSFLYEASKPSFLKNNNRYTIGGMIDAFRVFGFKDSYKFPQFTNNVINSSKLWPTSLSQKLYE